MASYYMPESVRVAISLKKPLRLPSEVIGEVSLSTNKSTLIKILPIFDHNPEDLFFWYDDLREKPMNEKQRESFEMMAPSLLIAFLYTYYDRIPWIMIILAEFISQLADAPVISTIQELGVLQRFLKKDKDYTNTIVQLLAMHCHPGYDPSEPRSAETMTGIKIVQMFILEILCDPRIRNLAHVCTVVDGAIENRKFTMKNDTRSFIPAYSILSMEEKIRQYFYMTKMTTAIQVDSDGRPKWVQSVPGEFVGELEAMKDEIYVVSRGMISSVFLCIHQVLFDFGRDHCAFCSALFDLKTNPRPPTCSGCRIVLYCGQECQRGHFKVHDPLCMFFKIAKRHGKDLHDTPPPPLPEAEKKKEEEEDSDDEEEEEAEPPKLTVAEARKFQELRRRVLQAGRNHMAAKAKASQLPMQPPPPPS